MRIVSRMAELGGEPVQIFRGKPVLRRLRLRMPFMLRQPRPLGQLAFPKSMRADDLKSVTAAGIGQP